MSFHMHLCVQAENGNVIGGGVCLSLDGWQDCRIAGLQDFPRPLSSFEG
jgi:hypothetical protein